MLLLFSTYCQPHGAFLFSAAQFNFPLPSLVLQLLSPTNIPGWWWPHLLCFSFAVLTQDLLPPSPPAIVSHHETPSDRGGQLLRRGGGGVAGVDDRTTDVLGVRSPRPVPAECSG